MKFCKNCGEELDPLVKFCKNCGSPVDEQDGATPVDGTPVSSVAPVEQAGLGGGQNQAPVSNRKPLSPKTKRLIGIIAAVVIGLFIAFKIIDSQFSAEKVVDSFAESVSESDAAAFKKHTFVKDDDIKLTEKNLKPLFAALKDDKSERKSIISNLRSQGKKYKKGKLDEDDIANEYEAFNLKEVKKWGIFSTYEVEISPVYVNVESSADAVVKIKVNGEDAGKLKEAYKSKKFGPYLPGNIKIVGSLDSDYVEIEEVEELTTFDPGPSLYASFYFSTNTVEFNAGFADGADEIRLLLNGEDTGIDILDEPKVPGLVTDGSLTYQYEVDFPWGEVATKERPVDTYYMNDDFLIPEDDREDIIERIVLAENEQLELMTTKGKKEQTVMTQEMAKEYKELIEKQLADSDDILEVALNKLEFGEEEFQYVYEEDQWFAKLTANVYYDLRTSKEGEDPGKFKEDKEVTTYYLSYDEDKEEWFLYHGEGAYMSSSQDTYDVKNEDKVVYKTGEPIKEVPKDKKDKKEDQKNDADKKETDDKKNKKTDDKEKKDEKSKDEDA